MVDGIKRIFILGGKKRKMVEKQAKQNPAFILGKCHAIIDATFAGKCNYPTEGAGNVLYKSCGPADRGRWCEESTLGMG